MSFKLEGFLSAEVANWTNTTRKKHARIFHLADAANQIANRSIALLPTSEIFPSKSKIIITGLFLRAIQAFQGTLILAEHGMTADARTLVRNACEATIKLGAIAKDEKYVQSLYDGHDQHRITQGSKLIDPKFLAVVGEQVEEYVGVIKSTIEKISTDRGNKKPQPESLEAMAIEPEMKVLYDTVFRGMSGDSAHATLAAIERHIYVDVEKKKRAFLFGPDDRDIESTLTAALFVHIQACRVLYSVAPIPQLHSDFQAFALEFANYLGEARSK